MTAARIGRFASPLVLVLAAVLVVTLGPAASAAPRAEQGRAPIDESLGEAMRRDPSGSFHVMVHGADIEAANAAVDATGMRKRGEFRKIGVVSAEATAPQIEAAREQPGVTYLEGEKRNDTLDDGGNRGF